MSQASRERFTGWYIRLLAGRAALEIVVVFIVLFSVWGGPSGLESRSMISAGIVKLVMLN